jgi:hypothetical protein
VYRGDDLDGLITGLPSVQPSTLQQIWTFCLDNAQATREYYCKLDAEAEALRLSTSQVGPSRNELVRRMEESRGLRAPA